MGGESSGLATRFVVSLVSSAVAPYVQEDVTNLEKRMSAAVYSVGLVCRLSPALSDHQTNVAFFRQLVLMLGHF